MYAQFVPDVFKSLRKLNLRRAESEISLIDSNPGISNDILIDIYIYRSHKKNIKRNISSTLFEIKYDKSR